MKIYFFVSQVIENKGYSFCGLSLCLLIGHDKATSGKTNFTPNDYLRDAKKKCTAIHDATNTSVLKTQVIGGDKF